MTITMVSISPLLDSSSLANKFQIFYINLLVLINISARYNTNLYPPEQEASILANPADVKNRIFGSRVVIGLEQSMMVTTWGVKICIWTFLLRVVYAEFSPTHPPRKTPCNRGLLTSIAACFLDSSSPSGSCLATSLAPSSSLKSSTSASSADHSPSTGHFPLRTHSAQHIMTTP
jgi:hypothetical protein